MSVTGNRKLDAALSFIARGWRVFPVKNKEPIIKGGLTSGTTSEDLIRTWFTRSNQMVGIGLTCGRVSGVAVVDIDLYKPGGQEAYEKLKKLPGYTENTVVSITGSGGKHLFFKYPTNGTVLNKQKLLGFEGVDVRGEGGYVVLPPTLHESGQEYRWEKGKSPDEIELAECPDFIIKGTQDTFGRDSAAEPHPDTINIDFTNVTQRPGANGNGNGNGNGDHSDESIPVSEGNRNSTLAAVAGSLRSMGLDEEHILRNLIEINRLRCIPPLPEDEVRVIASHIVQYPPHHNRNGNLNIPADPEFARRMLTFDRNDAGFGEMIAFFHGTKVRYNHTQARWLLWRQHFWVPDEKGEIHLKAIETADSFKRIAHQITDLAVQTDTLKYARSLKNKSRLDAGLSLAGIQPGLATTHTDWDSNPSVVAVLNGVIDLRDGSLRNGKPDDRISQWINLHFDPGARAERWLSFLGDIFVEPDVISFVQKAVGYSLTGETREQCLFMLLGKGANGKTTFLEVLRMIFNSYAFSAPFATFERTGSGQQQTNDLAAIANKRLVMAAEPKEGVILDEGRIKSLTGGEQISARFLHREFFQFTPICKIWLAANSLPRVVDDSHGFWRRVRMIKFLQQFVNKDEMSLPHHKLKDPELPVKLASELPGVLNWIVEGAQRWYREGLKIPEAVIVATDQYRTDSDPLHEFLSQHCNLEDDATVVADELYKAYTTFCESRMMKHFEIMSGTRFHTRMRQKFERNIVGDVPYYKGVSLREDSRHLTQRDIQKIILDIPPRRERPSEN